MSNYVKPKDRLIVAVMSGGVCAHPECNRYLIVGGTDADEYNLIGKCAHIFGRKPDSARHDPTLLPEFLNSVENLIFLCGYHHDLIDTERNTHTVELLQEWKSEHERSVSAVRSELRLEGVARKEFNTSDSAITELQDGLTQLVRELEGFQLPMSIASDGEDHLMVTALSKLSVDDRAIRQRLLGYSKWLDPALKDDVLSRLVPKGFDRGVIENNAQRLHEAELLQITENHYLPLDEEVCQQAAESLIDEFLQELEE